jgi:hypothetical protein
MPREALKKPLTVDRDGWLCVARDPADGVLQ